MVTNGYAPKWHWVWSVGHAAQFKSSKSWFLSTSIPISLGGARCYGVFLEADMATTCMMVLEQRSRGFCERSNLMLMGQSFKMQRRWWIFYVSFCQIDLKCHILVCGGPYNESFGL